MQEDHEKYGTNWCPKSWCGMISCLEQMERLCRHLKAKVNDFIGVNRWNKDYKLNTISEAAASMVQATF